jgi:two-component system, NarL family, sensor kinase
MRISSSDSLSVRRAVAQFALSGFAAVVLLGAAAAVVLRHVAEEEALREARARTVLAGSGIVAPAVDQRVIGGDPQALARLDRIVRTRVLGADVARVKIWTPSGKVVYSDDQRWAREHGFDRS